MKRGKDLSAKRSLALIMQDLERNQDIDLAIHRLNFNSRRFAQKHERGKASWFRKIKRALN